MLTPKFQSSGDVIADRRFEWARDCEAKGDLAAAADLMQQTLEIVPGYASAWFSLGSLREQLGDRPAAIEAYRKARETDPQDRHGAALMLMRLGAELTAEMPQGYVRELFDQYAPAFDRALRHNLNYRAPALLHDAVARVCADRGRPFSFKSALDLGCGTGLAGETFRSSAGWLVGVDLSAGMIAEATRKSLYDRLVASDLKTFLAEELEGGAQYHLMLAADVFVYFSDLSPIAAAAFSVLAPDGLIAFTVEAHDGEGFVLGEKLRYAHGAAHVRWAFDASGFNILHLEAASTRTENGVPVPGLIAVAERR